MLKLESIRADLEAEKNGQFIEIPEWEGVSLGVRSLELPAYKLAVSQLQESYKRKYGAKAAPHDVQELDIRKLLAKHILFGWEGIDPPYTEDGARDFLIDPSGRELAKKIVWASLKVAEVEVEFTADAVKN